MQLPRPVERVIGGRPHSKCSRLRAGDKRHDASCELRSGRNWGPRAGAGRCRRCKLCRKRSVHARDDRVVHQVESFRDELKMHPIVHGNIARHAEVNVADARPGMAVAFCGGWSFTAVFVIVEVQCAIRKCSQVLAAAGRLACIASTFSAPSATTTSSPGMENVDAMQAKRPAAART